jgi:hypothetical protein
MPARALSRPTASPCRPDRRAVRKVCQALLRPLRGHLFAQIFAPRLDRRCLLWNVLPAPPIPCLPRVPPSQEWTYRPCSRRSEPRPRRWCDRRRSAAPWAHARRARRGLRGSRRCHQHGCGCATRGAVPSAYLWLPGERSGQVAALARSHEGQVRAMLPPFTPAIPPPDLGLFFFLCADKSLVSRRSKARRPNMLYTSYLSLVP